MEGNENLKLLSSSQLNKHHPLLRKILQFLVSVCLLLILVSYSSSISKVHLSTLPYPLMNQTLERKYMFLLCNGILAILAKNMNLNGNSPASEDVLEVMSQMEAPQEGDQEKQEHGKEIDAVSVREEEDKENTALVTIKDQEKEEAHGNSNKNTVEYGSSPSPLLADEERESPGRITGIEDQEEKYCYDGDDDKRLRGSGSLTPSSLAEDGVYQTDMSTEELNRKIEEFIRKMKEEIKIGAQKELITVQSAS